MKKIMFLGIVFALFAVTASAQQRDGIQRQRIQRGFETHQLTRGEKFKLKKGQFHYRHEKRRAMRDGRVGPMEKRRLHKMRMHNNRETFRMRHNGRRRVI
ncbi:MAG: hypothetical protein WDN26_08480 [Chitinophagaceae bacterium]